jgi:hypothetical protein
MFPHGRHANHPRDADKMPQAIRDAVYNVYGAEMAETVLLPSLGRTVDHGDVPLVEVNT